MNTITTLVRNSVRIIRINKPDKKNAVCALEFDNIRKILENDVNDDTTKLSVLTGSNDFFTSGLDMNDAFKHIIEKDDNYAEKTVTAVRKLIEQIIDYPKLLIGIVNGAAIGIGTTILPFFDYVYASEKAIFQAPFAKLGLNAEACSSLIFPIMMNRMNAFELIFLGKKFDVIKAKEVGLVGQIYKDEENSKVYEEIEQIAKIPYDTLKRNKNVIVSNFREGLLECNKRECEVLKVSMRSSHFLNTVNMFVTRKNKM